MTKLTLKQAQGILRAIGITLTKNSYNEYRVAFRGKGNEDSAYYTNDLQDAVDTGRHMAAHAAATFAFSPAWGVQ